MTTAVVRRTIVTADGSAKTLCERLGRSNMLVLREPVILAAEGTRSGEEKLIGEGTVAIPRRLGEGTNAVQYAIYPHGAFEALRGCLHAKEGYGLDGRGELRTVRLTQRAAADALRLLWLWGDLSADQRRRAEELIARLVAVSEQWRNVFKRDAADRLEASLYVEDRLGRKNPAAAAANITAAQRALKMRLEEVSGIVPWLGLRETALLLELDRIYDIMVIAWEVLGIVGAGVGLIEGGVIKAISDRERHAWVVTLRDQAERLASVHIEPFLTNFGEASREIESAARHLLRGRQATAKELVVRARNGLRFKFAQFQLEELLRHFSIGLETGALSTDDLDFIVWRVDGFRKRLQKLRISGLRHDPYEEVREHTEHALEEFGKRQLSAAKDALKAASHAM